MGETLHCRGGDTEGDRTSSAKKWHGSVDERHVAEDSRSYTVFAIGLGVFEQSRAGVGAFIVVVARLLVHAEFGVMLELSDVEAVEVVGLRCHCCRVIDELYLREDLLDRMNMNGSGQDRYVVALLTLAAS